MRAFFARLYSTDPEHVAKKYGKFFWKKDGELRDQDRLLKSPFHVGLGIHGSEYNAITKRVPLVSDTLLLSNRGEGNYYEIARYRSELDGVDPEAIKMHALAGGGFSADHYGIKAPDLRALGQWIMDSEPLLCAGLVWYLPSYATSSDIISGKTKLRESKPVGHTTALDILSSGRKAVTLSIRPPAPSRFVKTVLEVDLPFIDGVDLRTFSKITADEFGSYTAFRDFLRNRFAELDGAMDSDQADLQLMRIGSDIRDGIRAVHAQMAKIRTIRAVAASGAVVTTGAAVLTAVYGPAIAPAVAALGATGGLWGAVHAVTENSVRTLRDGKPWYYVWTLSKKVNHRGVL